MFASVFVERKTLSDDDFERIEVVIENITNLLSGDSPQLDFTQCFQIAGGALRLFSKFHQKSNKLCQLLRSHMDNNDEFCSQWTKYILNPSHTINSSCINACIQELTSPMFVSMKLAVIFGREFM